MSNSDPLVFIIIPVFNRVKHTLKCLKSIREQTYKNYQVIIVDDNSTDGTFEIISKEFPEVKLLKGNGNLYWTGGTNLGVVYALKNARDSDYILTLNNDTIIEPNYLQHKIGVAKTNPNSIFGSLCVFMDEPDKIETTGFVMDFKKCSSRSLSKFGEKIQDIKSGIQKITHLCGKGVLIPVKVFEELGLYDQKNFPHYHADTAFTLNAHINGFNVYIDYDSVVYSDISSSGIGTKNTPPSINEFIKSLFSIKSVNHIRTRVNFAKLFFPNILKRIKYLINIYFKTFGGFLIRYYNYRILRK